MILPATADIPNNLAAVAQKELLEVTATLAAGIEGSPVTEQELRNAIKRFPLLPAPATLTPDAEGLEEAPQFLRLPPGANIVYEPTGWDGNADKCYYIRHAEPGTACTPLPSPS